MPRNGIGTILTSVQDVLGGSAIQPFITDAQARLAAKFVGIVREIALGRDHSLELGR